MDAMKACTKVEGIRHIIYSFANVIYSELYSVHMVFIYWNEKEQQSGKQVSQPTSQPVADVETSKETTHRWIINILIKFSKNIYIVMSCLLTISASLHHVKCMSSSSNRSESESGRASERERKVRVRMSLNKLVFAQFNVLLTIHQTHWKHCSQESIAESERFEWACVHGRACMCVCMLCTVYTVQLHDEL